MIASAVKTATTVKAEILILGYAVAMYSDAFLKLKHINNILFPSPWNHTHVHGQELERTWPERAGSQGIRWSLVMLRFYICWNEANDTYTFYEVYQGALE
jgi:hypothetical protein